MSFDPFELSVKEILEGDRRYKIPNFQRDFSWQKSNFDDFYEDLFLSSKLDFGHLEVDFHNKYFFGMILLLGDKTSPDVSKPYEVIDGQQRLTTITLFFAAIHGLIKSINQDYMTEFSERLYFKSVKNEKSDQIQRLVNDSLNPIFPIEILDLNNMKSEGATVEAESSEQKWLIEAYEYIKTKLLTKDNILSSINLRYNRNLAECSSDDYVEFLDNFGKHLSNATMICIYHKNREEAHTLFRNLNYRGKPLSQPDLIKNEIFSILEKGDNYALSKWKNIEENIYYANETIQKFIYHYMYGRYSSISSTNLFQKFLDNINKDKSSYINYLGSLEQASSYYKNFIKPEDNAKIFKKNNYFKTDNNQSLKRYFEFFNKIEISQLRILLISLFESREKEYITNTVFSNFIKIIARHQCVHVVAKSSANKLNSLYASSSKKLLSLSTLSEKEARTKETNQIFTELVNGLVSKMPEKNSFIEVDLKYTGKPIKEMKSNEIKEHALIRFILATISEERQSKDTNRANDGLSFIHYATLEHIVDKDTIGDNIYSLGNLLLLERDVHKDVKDEIEKRDMYSKSKITLSKKFYDDYSTFDISMIPERKQKLLIEYYDLIKA